MFQLFGAHRTLHGQRAESSQPAQAIRWSWAWEEILENMGCEVRAFTRASFFVLVTVVMLFSGDGARVYVVVANGIYRGPGCRRRM